MVDLSSLEIRKKLYITTLFGVGCLRFINLGFLDLQAWDEALYAVRAEGILLFGGFLDQASFSIGGLYSALHPPLFVWLTSLSFLIFGVTEFAARFISALFGALTLFAIYRLGEKLQNVHVGFLAALLFGLNPFVTFLARQGQFDTTVVFFLTLSVIFYLSMEATGRISSSVSAGFALGAALMTKLFVGFGIPLAYFLWKSLRPIPRMTHVRLFAISLGIMVLVAAPWHVYLTVTRGFGNPFFFFDASAIVERSISGIEGNVKPLEWLYFVNQLVVLFPLGILWFALGLVRIFRQRDEAWLFPAAWFTLFFIVFTLMRTKLSVYALPMLVPASLIGARELLRFREQESNRTPLILLLGGTSLVFLWSSSQTWRNLVKSVFGDLVHAHLPSLVTLTAILPFIALATLLLMLCYLLYRNDLLRPVRLSLPLLIILPSFLMTFYDIVGHDKHQYRDGAHELAAFVAQRNPAAIVIVGFDRNPQFTFYLDGADIGWREDLAVRRLTPPSERSHFRSWLSDQVSDLPGTAIVVVEKDKIVRYEWITTDEATPTDFTLVFDSKRYAVFQRVPTTQLALISR